MADGVINITDCQRRRHCCSQAASARGRPEPARGPSNTDTNDSNIGKQIGRRRSYPARRISGLRRAGSPRQALEVAWVPDFSSSCARLGVHGHLDHCLQGWLWPRRQCHPFRDVIRPLADSPRRPRGLGLARRPPPKTAAAARPHRPSRRAPRRSRPSWSRWCSWRMDLWPGSFVRGSKALITSTNEDAASAAWRTQ